MKINPISNITRKALPLAAASAIGLGTLASCSSSNKDLPSNSEHYRTEVIKLDNALDSLKSVRGESAIEFLDYYAKSKDVLDNAKLSQSETKESNQSNTLFGVGVGLLMAGTIGVGTSLFKASIGKGDWSTKYMKVFVPSFLATLFGIGLASITTIISTGSKAEAEKNFEQHKEVKLNELEMERQYYMGAKSVELGDVK